MIWPSESKPMASLDRACPLARGLVCAARMDRPGPAAPNLAYPHLLTGAAAAGGLATPIQAVHQEWYNRFGSGYAFCLWHDGITLADAWGALLVISDGTVVWQRYGSNNCFRTYHNGVGYTMTNFLLDHVAAPGFLTVLWDVPDLRVYINGQQIESVACGVAPKTTSSTSTLTVGGSTTIRQFLAYDRPLSVDEIQALYRTPSAPFDRGRAWPPAVAAGGTTHNLAGSVDGISSLSGAGRIARALSGQTAGDSSLASVLRCTRNLSGLCMVQGNLAASLTLGNVVTLSATVQTKSSSSASLSVQTSEPAVPVSPDQRSWRAGVLCNGMTSDALKLGTVLTRGWFWTRRAGCLAVYRGPTANQVDFGRLVHVAEPNAQAISLSEYLLPDAGSRCCYVVRRFNGHGDQERTTGACFTIRVDDTGKPVDPAPNNVVALSGVQIPEGLLRLQWSYCPLGQRARPARFNVYMSDVSGQIDFETPLKVVPYQGGRHYRCLIDVPSQGSRDVVVRAETADGVEGIPGRMLNWQGRTILPHAITLLAAEGIL